jgi:hypothetical protein
MTSQLCILWGHPQRSWPFIRWPMPKFRGRRGTLKSGMYVELIWIGGSIILQTNWDVHWCVKITCVLPSRRIATNYIYSMKRNVKIFCVFLKKVLLTRFDLSLNDFKSYWFWISVKRWSYLENGNVLLDFEQRARGVTVTWQLMCNPPHRRTNIQLRQRFRTTLPYHHYKGSPSVVLIFNNFRSIIFNGEKTDETEWCQIYHHIFVWKNK